MNLNLKTKIIIVSVLVIILLFLIIIFCKPEKQIENKEIKSEKVITENVVVSSIQKNISVKAKNYKYTVNKTLPIADTAVSTTDTIYAAYADTSFLITDTLGKPKGIINLNTEYISDIKLSDNAKFNYRFNSILFSENKIYKETESLNINKVSQNENKFGLGLFAGGLLTNDRKLTYGIGIGLFYKLIY